MFEHKLSSARAGKWAVNGVQNRAVNREVLSRPIYRPCQECFARVEVEGKARRGERYCTHSQRHLLTTSVFLPTASGGAEAVSFHTFLLLRCAEATLGRGV
jgi:hypothetical protein